MTEMSSSDRLGLIARLQTRELTDRDHLVLIEVLRHGVVSLEKLERRERDDARRGQSKTEGEKPGKPASGLGSNQIVPPRKVKGHGRLGEQSYPGASTENISHAHLSVGDRCPECGCGRLYGLEPGKHLTLMASAPVKAVRYLVQRMRCSGCQTVIHAQPPRRARYGKHHPSANAAVTLMKYGLGVPFKRLEQWQGHLGVPLPDATQWEMVETVADCLYKIYLALEDRAADSALFHVDDTSLPILSLIKKNQKLGDRDRYGMHASGILARDGGSDIYLYYMGRRHCGENLGRLLDKRSPGLPMPVQMGDASACNTKHDHASTACFCSSHAIRKFKEAHPAYPDHVGRILALLKTVFENEAHTRKEGMTEIARLAYHSEHSTHERATSAFRQAYRRAFGRAQ